MIKKTVSKCGARHQPKKEEKTKGEQIEDLLTGIPFTMKEFPEKKTVKKSTPKKAILQFDNGELSILPVENENEN